MRCLRSRLASSAIILCLPGSKASPGVVSAEGEAESGAGPGRKRRWGSSTAVTAKKPSISITTDSLKVQYHHYTAKYTVVHITNHLSKHSMIVNTNKRFTL